MRLFYILFLVLTGLIFSACSAPEKPVIPEWVMHPPASTAQELYGVSVAHSPSEAVVSAAGGVASGILNAATPKLDQEHLDKSLHAKTADEMKALLVALDYSKITVKEQVAMDKETAVLVSIQRNEIVMQLKTRLQKDSEAISLAIKAKNEAPDFSRLGTLGKAHEQQARLMAEILLLETVDPSADTAEFRAQSKKIEDDYNALKFGFVVSVISDANAIVYVETLKKALRSEGITSDGKPSGTILLTADSQQEHSGGKYLVKTRLHLESTANGKKISENELYLQAESVQNYTDAHQKTASTLNRLLKKEGLFHTLGF